MKKYRKNKFFVRNGCMVGIKRDSPHLDINFFQFLNFLFSMSIQKLIRNILLLFPPRFAFSFSTILFSELKEFDSFRSPLRVLLNAVKQFNNPKLLAPGSVLREMDQKHISLNGMDWC